VEEEVKEVVKNAETATLFYKSAKDMITAAGEAAVGMVRNLTAKGGTSPQMVMIFLTGIQAWLFEVREKMEESHTFFEIERDKLTFQVEQLKEQIRIANVSLEAARDQSARLKDSP
jgi:hypothetical protein